jgi:hypothetical protein
MLVRENREVLYDIEDDGKGFPENDFHQKPFY